MNNQIIKTGFLLFFVVALTLGLSFALQSLLAAPNWVNPTASPPGNNVPAPVNYGSSTAPTTILQSAWSNLDVGAIFTASSSAQVVNSFGVSTYGGPFYVSNDVLGGTDGRVGIGTLNPGAKLDIDMATKTTTEGLRISRDVAPSHFAYLNILDENSNTIFMVKEDGNVGIGTNIPGAKLDVNGTLKISGGNPGQGKVLMSDATGLASWVATSSLGISGSGGGGGFTFINPVPVYTGAGSIAWTTYDASAVIPSGASHVILESQFDASVSGYGPNLEIRADASSPTYLLARGAAGGGGDAVSDASQAVFPITSGRTFQYQITGVFDTISFRVIGYISGGSGGSGGSGNPAYQSASVNITDHGTQTLTHNLGYIPVCTWTSSNENQVVSIRSISTTQIQLYGWSPSLNQNTNVVVSCWGPVGGGGGGTPTFLGNFSGGYANAGVTTISTTCTAGNVYTIYDTGRAVYDLCICRQANQLACFPG